MTNGVRRLAANKVNKTVGAGSVYGPRDPRPVPRGGGDSTRRGKQRMPRQPK